MLASHLYSTLFLVFRHSWAYLFNDDPEVVALTASIIPLLSLFQVFDGTSAVTGGILRARGKQVSISISRFSVFMFLLTIQPSVLGGTSQPLRILHFRYPSWNLSGL